MVFHVTTERKLKKYKETGAILPPVRYWMTEYMARMWMKKTGRKSLVSFIKPEISYPLPIRGASWSPNCVKYNKLQVIE